MGLKDIEARLLPGFRFHPTDEELVCHYLSKKAIESTTGYKDEADALKNMGMSLVEVDLHTIEPWQLPEVAKLNETEWYFFSFRDRKYATGLRTNRATTIGYWKATGKDRVIQNPSTRSVVGMRKTLVFYKNRAPNGIKTGWIMHEFRLDTPHLPPKEDWVLCRVSHRIKISSALHNCFSNLGCCQPSGVTNYRINNNYGDYNSNVICKLRAEEERNTVIAGSSVAEMNSVDNGGGGGRGDYDFLWVMNIEETNSLAPSNEQDTIWMETI